MSVIIIGSTSLLGQSLVKKMDNAGLYYKTLDRKDGFNFICDYSIEEWLIFLGDSHTIIVISWIGSPSNVGESLLEGVDINCRAINTLSLAIKERGFGHMIFTSSAGAIYGRHDSIIDENTKCSPISLYGEAKLKAEQSIKKCFDEDAKLQASLLRISNIFGKRQQIVAGFDLINHLTQAIQSEKTFTIYGDGKSTRDFIYVDDVADIILKILTTNNSGCEIYNVGQGQSHSVLEVIQTIEDCLNKKLAIQFVQERACDIPHIRLSCKKVQQALAWKPKNGLLQGVKKIVNEK